MRRKRLQEFRHELIDSLSNVGFNVPNEAIKVFYEGRFMSISARYAKSKNISYLKPFVPIECFVGELAIEPVMVDFTTLVKLTLGEECAHRSKAITCVALDETAAEKKIILHIMKIH